MHTLPENTSSVQSAEDAATTILRAVRGILAVTGAAAAHPFADPPSPLACALTEGLRLLSTLDQRPAADLAALVDVMSYANEGAPLANACERAAVKRGSVRVSLPSDARAALEARADAAHVPDSVLARAYVLFVLGYRADGTPAHVRPSDLAGEALTVLREGERIAPDTVTAATCDLLASTARRGPEALAILDTIAAAMHHAAR